MRVAYLSHGVSVHDIRYLEKMSKNGYEAFVISVYDGKVEIDLKGITVLHRNYYDVVRFDHLHELQVAYYLRRLLKKIKPDVMHSGFVQYYGFYGALSGFHPNLLMPWGSDILIYPDVSRYNKFITKFTIRRADMITCDCEEVKNKIVELAKYPTEKITIFPWGIDLEIFNPHRGACSIRDTLGWQDKKILIMTRNFESVYGIKYFIDALPEIFASEPDTRIIFVGSGSLLESYKTKIQQMKLDEFVYFAGRVSQRELGGYLNASDIYVTSSLSDGTSLSLLEAMACRLPVVVTNIPANYEWIEDGVNGYIVPVKDSEILAGRILELLKGPELRQKMGERNFEVAQQRADWDTNFARLEAMYGALLRGKQL